MLVADLSRQFSGSLQVCHSGQDVQRCQGGGLSLNRAIWLDDRYHIVCGMRRWISRSVVSGARTDEVRTALPYC